MNDKEKKERYFAEAFCAKKATVLPTTAGFKVQAVVEIETGDQRGTIYVAAVKKE